MESYKTDLAINNISDYINNQNPYYREMLYNIVKKRLRKNINFKEEILI